MFLRKEILLIPALALFACSEPLLELSQPEMGEDRVLLRTDGRRDSMPFSVEVLTTQAKERKEMFELDANSGEVWVAVDQKTEYVKVTNFSLGTLMFAGFGEVVLDEKGHRNVSGGLHRLAYDSSITFLKE